jgi:predicted secreted protein
MAVKLGIDAKLYRNIGSYDSPVLVEVTNVKDLTINMEKNEADVTTRGSNGWREMVGVLKDGTVEFQMIWDTDDTNFEAIKDAFFNNSTVEFFVMSGDVDDDGTEGLRATMAVLKFSKNEPLEEAQTVDVTIRPTRSAHAPQWVTGAAYGAFD